MPINPGNAVDTSDLLVGPTQVLTLSTSSAATSTAYSSPANGYSTKVRVYSNVLCYLAVNAVASSASIPLPPSTIQNFRVPSGQVVTVLGGAAGNAWLTHVAQDLTVN